MRGRAEEGSTIKLKKLASLGYERRQRSWDSWFFIQNTRPGTEMAQRRWTAKQEEKITVWQRSSYGKEESREIDFVAEEISPFRCEKFGRDCVGR